MASPAFATRPIPKPQKVTNGWAKIPNALIENQALFTRAEFALAVIVCRKGDGGIDDAQVTDDNWRKWTGLTPRMKEKAGAGLLGKGFTVDGRGDKARYRFSAPAWEAYVLRTERDSKPRTAGRGVEPKPGAKVHPECRDNGCQRLCEEQNGLSLVCATNIAKPVSQTELVNVAGANTVSGTSKPASSIPATRIAKPVSRTAIEMEWPSTLGTLQTAFPMVGAHFLGRLVKVVRKRFSGVDDEELARAVRFAWVQKRKIQESEALFESTVPEAIAALRRASTAPAASVGLGFTPFAPTKPEERGGSPIRLEEFRSKLLELGGPIADHAAGLDLVIGMISDSREPSEIEVYLSAVADAIKQTASDLLSAEQNAAVVRSINITLAPYKAKMSKLQLDEQRQILVERFTFEALGLPLFGRASLRSLWP